MAFTTAERIAKSDKLSQQISGSANASPSEKFWYNEQVPYAEIVPLQKIWNDWFLLPGAATPTDADNAVLLNPTILEKRKVRLTLDAGSNQRSYQARMTYGDITSDFYENWIQPSLIRNNGDMSAGYIVRLFSGDPDTTGVELPTSYLSDVTGAPSWEWNYSMGLLLVSTDQSAAYYSDYFLSGLYVVGYRYIGPTGGGASSGGSLNQAYNYGGAGAGRSITVLPSKPVEFLASGKCSVFLDGYMSLNTIIDPTPIAGKGNLYSSNPGSGTSELFYMDNNGATTQITEDGYLATANSLTRVGLYAHPNDPHMNPGEGFLYAKPVSTGLELFFMDGKGRAIQITKDGKLAKR
jgi:hypothetical protein